MELRQVEAALSAGLGWVDIADCLRVSRQPVHEKYRDRVSPELAPKHEGARVSALTMPITVTAAWREAVRARDPYVDLDHLLIGLITAGGAASRVLSRHGLSVPSERT